MINKIALMTTLLVMACIGLLMFLAFHYYGQTVSQAASLSTLTQQKKEAEFIVQSQGLSVGIFNQIAGATLNDQQTNQTASQRRQTIIKRVLQTAPCNLVPVAAAANDSLLNHYNAVRQSSRNTDTLRSARAVPAVSTAQ
ncbi:hypothetical protein ITX54_03615 [Rouxiella silvae]|uniref:DUF2570 domain-containing protein n=1 Tax=Rouxiella silvae TaxID=1646373 RepID=A0AA40WZ26_9GAMM|nr:hypothetical protein [Rouxiella silvae]MBF6635750.1 hypothetical protein [Rouxiella silvae]